MEQKQHTEQDPIFNGPPKAAFSTPEGYFEALPHKISDRIHTAKKPVVLPEWRPALLAIAAVAAVWCITFIYQPEVKQTAGAETWLTNEVLVESGYLSQMDESLLLESFTKAELTDIQQDSDMEDYLMEHKTDINLIINEL